MTERFVFGRRFLLLTFLTEYWSEAAVKSAFRAGFGESEIGMSKRLLDDRYIFGIPATSSSENLGNFANALRAELSRLG